MGLKIFNTASAEKEDFVPIEPGKVGMYVCGITSSGAPHIGHARCYIAFDVVYRWLARRYDVHLVRNITDIDDKIIVAARAAGEDPRAFAERNIERLRADMAALGCENPRVEPRVTDHIPEIIELIADLEKKEFAYESDGEMYFEIKKFKKYGELSGRTHKVINQEAYKKWAGGRLEVDERKISPYDFALWKRGEPGDPTWPAPWGRGRPAWHIECSAMSKKYLGTTFDIHGGGKDLIFPHHDNEIAQSCGSSGASHLARIWMHNGFVELMPERCPSCGVATVHSAAGESVSEACGSCGYELGEFDLKMSKSRGNFYPVREIVERYRGEALRYLFLMTHYRSPVRFAHALLDDTEARLDRMYTTLKEIDEYVRDHGAGVGRSFAEIFGWDPWRRFEEAMDDDFNTPKALADIAELIHLANALVAGPERCRVKLAKADTARVLGEVRGALRAMGAVFGLWLEDPVEYLRKRNETFAAQLEIRPDEIQSLIEQRLAARRSKDFAKSDGIRAQLLSKGIALKDTAKCTEWYAIAVDKAK